MKIKGLLVMIALAVSAGCAQKNYLKGYTQGYMDAELATLQALKDLKASYWDLKDQSKRLIERVKQGCEDQVTGEESWLK